MQRYPRTPTLTTAAKQPAGWPGSPVPVGSTSSQPSEWTALGSGSGLKTAVLGSSGVGSTGLGTGSALPSDIETSAGRSARSQAGIERRVAWLEEDVSLLHRRMRDECGEGEASSGDGGLRAVVTLLDNELVAERQAREVLENKILRLEELITQERMEREGTMRNFSNELETTMRSLISRVDEGISAGAAAMRERTDQTESRLRTLIKRVDKGLSQGAAALQDSLSTSIVSPDNSALPTPAARPSQTSAVVPSNPPSANEPKSSSPTPGGAATLASLAQSQLQGSPGLSSTTSTELSQLWEQLRRENAQLKEKLGQPQGTRSPTLLSNSLKGATPSQSITPSVTPSLAMPGTLQVPGSGLGADSAGPGRRSMSTSAAGTFSRRGAGSPSAAKNPALPPQSSKSPA